MSLRYGYFDSEIDGYDEEGMPIFDRAESSDFLALFISQIISDGVLAAPATCFQVVADEGMNVTVMPGFGIVKGRFAIYEQSAVLTLENAPQNYKRIDRVVLRANYPERKCEIIVKTGIPAATPVAPELLQPSAGDYYELSLATIAINSNQTVITQSSITDTRYDSSVCGVVTQLIDHLDTSVFFAQLNAFYDEYVARFNADYSDFTLRMDSAYQNFYTRLVDLYNSANDRYETDYAAFTQDMLDAYNQYLADLASYFSTLQTTGYSQMADVISRMADFETTQEAAFDAWWDTVKGKMDGDIGAACVEQLINHEGRITALEDMLISGEVYAPLAAEDGDVLTTEYDEPLEAYWYLATR